MPISHKSPFDPGYIAIIGNLALAREQKGMTQAQLGAAMGESQVFVSRIELKQRRLDVWEFVRVCRALEIDPAQVLTSIPPQ
jgi:transcriptional regulator with XRE-family HTH domain